MYGFCLIRKHFAITYKIVITKVPNCIESNGIFVHEFSIQYSNWNGRLIQNHPVKCHFGVPLYAVEHDFHNTNIEIKRSECNC